MDSSADLREVATEALHDVVDPELGIDIVSMGLVYDVRDEDGVVVVEMTLTMPGCPVSETVAEDVRVALSSALGERPIRVDIVWEPAWTPERLTEEAAEALGYRR